MTGSYAGTKPLPGHDQAASGSRPCPLTIQLAEIPRLDFSLRIRERTWQFLEITNVLIHRENQLTHNYINRHYQKDITTLYTARVTICVQGCVRVCNSAKNYNYL